MKLFVDMDGVLADFDTHYKSVFGAEANKLLDNVDWEAVRRVQNFYLHIPPMVDLYDLWGHIEKYRPTVLTGVPDSVPEAPDNKRAWVRKNLGDAVPVICCRSRDKSLHAERGDVLIDDWEKYRHLWIAKGGNWITHTNAATTIRLLAQLGL